MTTNEHDHLLQTLSWAVKCFLDFCFFCSAIREKKGKKGVAPIINFLTWNSPFWRWVIYDLVFNVQGIVILYSFHIFYRHSWRFLWDFLGVWVCEWIHTKRFWPGIFFMGKRGTFVIAAQFCKDGLNKTHSLWALKKKCYSIFKQINNVWIYTRYCHRLRPIKYEYLKCLIQYLFELYSVTLVAVSWFLPVNLFLLVVKIKETS